MNNNVNIVKRDGSKEPFSYDKLVTSIAKAGVPIADSENIAQALKTWIFETAVSGEISSTAIRDKITEKLMIDFPMQADNYQVFKKS